MPNKTYTEYTFLNQDAVDISKKCITTVRDGYSSVPDTSKKEKTAGVGGTGGKSTTVSGGTAYHNISYLSLPTLLSDIPKGAKITKATATFQILRADQNNLQACVWNVCPCDNFSNKLTGKNKPAVYTSYKGSVSVPKVSKPATTQTATIDITSCIQYMTRNNKKCVQLYTDRGSNRRYVKNPAKTTDAVKFSIDYAEKPTFSSKSIITDCVNTSGQNSSYVQNTITFSANGNGSYYRYSYKSGNYSNTSGWVTSTSKSIDIDTKIKAGASITATIETAFFNSDLGTGSIESYSTTLTKNSPPFASIADIPTSNNKNNPSNAYYINDNKCIAQGTMSVSINSINYYGIKKSYYNGSRNKPYTKVIKFGSKNIKTDTGFTTSKFSGSVTMPNKEQDNTVELSISNGWETWTKTYTIKSAAPLKNTLSGIFSKDKVFCNILQSDGRKFISTITQSKDIPETIGTKKTSHTVTVVKTNASSSDTYTSTTSFDGSKGQSQCALTHTVTSYRYATSTKNIYYTYTITYTNTIGQTLTDTHRCYINIRPQISGLSFSRNIADIFSHTTFAQDAQLGYTTFVTPKIYYTDPTKTGSARNATKFSDVTVKVNQILDRDANDEKSLRIQLKGKSESTANFDTTVSDTIYTWKQNASHLGTGKITVSAYDGYNYGYDKDEDSHTINVLTSDKPASPSTFTVLSYHLWTEGGDATKIIVDDNGTQYYPTSYSGTTTCGPYIRILVPLANSGTAKVPNTLEKHIRLQVTVKQLGVEKYTLVSDINNTVVHNGVQYHEMFFPINLTNKSDSTKPEGHEAETIQFYVSYVDRFENASDAITDSNYYQVFELPTFPVCGTQGGGYRWLFVNPQYFIDENNSNRVNSLINTEWTINPDADLYSVLTNNIDGLDSLNFRLTGVNAPSTDIIYTGMSVESTNTDAPIVIDDLSNTTWYFNEVLDLSGLPSGTIKVNFVSNNKQYTQMARDITGSGFHYYNPTTYSLASVYSDGHWDNSDVYRTITITDGESVTSSSFIQWLVHNAILVQQSENDVAIDLSGTVWVLKSEIVNEDVASYNINFVANHTEYKSFIMGVNALSYKNISDVNIPVYSSDAWSNVYNRIISITDGDDIHNQELYQWLITHSDLTYIKYNNNEYGDQVVCTLSYNPLQQKYDNYWLVNNAFNKIYVEGGNSITNIDLINWLYDNATCNQTNLIDEDYLRTPIFYTTVINPNTTRFQIQPFLYIKNGDNIVEVTHDEKVNIPAGSLTIPSSTLMDFVFKDDQNNNLILNVNTEYYIILKLYDYGTTAVIDATKFDRDATYTLSYYYQRNDEENAKVWGIDDYLPDTYIQSEQMNVINHYIKRVWNAYMIEGEVPLINLYKNDIVIGQNPEEAQVEQTATFPIPRNPLFYYPTQSGDGVNLCGTELTKIDNNTYETLYIPWNGMNKNLQIQIPVSSTSSGSNFTINVYYYDNNLTQIYSNISDSYVFTETLTAPAKYKGGSITYGTPKLYFNEILTNYQNFLSNVMYIKVRISLAPNTNITILHDNTDILYVGGVHDTSTGFDTPVAYEGLPDSRTITFYVDNNGNMSKTAVIHNMRTCLMLLRSEIYGVIGHKYNYNNQHILKEHIYYTDDENHTSYVVSYDHNNTERYPGVGDIDSIAISNAPDGSCSLFDVFKDF